jgi:hypothetical protein
MIQFFPSLTILHFFVLRLTFSEIFARSWSCPALALSICLSHCFIQRFTSSTAVSLSKDPHRPFLSPPAKMFCPHYSMDPGVLLHLALILRPASQISVFDRESHFSGSHPNHYLRMFAQDCHFPALGRHQPFSDPFTS